MKRTVITRITATALAAVSVMILGCTCAFAAPTPDDLGGADVYIDNQVVHYDDVLKAWSKAATTESEVKVVLNQDWTADSNGSFGEGKGFKDGALYLFDHTEKVTLDLNGHTIDRNLDASRKNGFVFITEKCEKFIIMDSSPDNTGLITGGYNNGNGGAVHVKGSCVNLERVKVSGNKCTNRGGAFYLNVAPGTVEYQSTLRLNNCYITDNYAKTGGAAYLETHNHIVVTDTKITGNSAVNDGGIHTEVSGLSVSSVRIGGKVIIADNYAEKDGKGLMLDESIFRKVVIEYIKDRPLSDDSHIVILSKTSDRTLRITEDSSNNHIGCYTYENNSYKIIAKGSGEKQYLDIKKN